MYPNYEQFKNKKLRVLARLCQARLNNERHYGEPEGFLPADELCGAVGGRGGLRRKRQLREEHGVTCFRRSVTVAGEKIFLYRINVDPDELNWDSIKENPDWHFNDFDRCRQLELA